MKRMQLRTAWAWAMIASLWMSAATLRADEDEAVGEALLPKEVLVYFSIPSVPDLKERLDDSLFGEMMKDENFQPVIEAIKEKIAENAGKIQEEVGVTLDDILAIPQGEVTFAVVELPSRKLALVLMLDYGDNEATVDKLLDKMEGGLKEAGGDVEGEDIGGVNIRTFTFENEAENPFNKFAYFDHDGYLVFSSDPQALTAIVERWDGKSDDTFAEHDVYKYILEKCSAGDRDPALKWFINPIGLTQAAVGMMQAQLPQAGLVLGFLPILGLDKLKGMGGAGDIGVNDYDSVSQAFIYVDQPTSGVLNMFQFPATELAPPKWVAADVSMYTAMNWNVSGAYTAIESLVDSFQGPGAFGKLVDQMSENEDGPKLHMKKDLIDQLTGQMHVVMGASEQEPEEQAVPKVLFALDIKNAAKMNAVLAKAAKAEGFPGKTRDFEGVTIYEMDRTGNEAALAVSDKHLMIATDVALLENALRPSGSASTLGSDPVYKQLAKKFPKKASMLGFQNGSNQVQAAYQLIKSGNFPDLPDEVRDIVSKLPDFEAVKKYLRASGGYTVPDKKGASSVSFTLKEQN